MPAQSLAKAYIIVCPLGFLNFLDLGISDSLSAPGNSKVFLEKHTMGKTSGRTLGRAFHSLRAELNQKAEASVDWNILEGNH